jgi:hypothetical protein
VTLIRSFELGSQLKSTTRCLKSGAPCINTICYGYQIVAFLVCTLKTPQDVSSFTKGMTAPMLLNAEFGLMEAPSRRGPVVRLGATA